MSVEDNKDNLEEIIDEQCRRVHELEVTTALIKGILLSRYLLLFYVAKSLNDTAGLQNDTLSLIGKHDIKDELQRMHEEVSQVSYSVGDLRNTLERMKKQNVRLKVSSNDVFAVLLLPESVEDNPLCSYRNYCH